MVDAKSQWRAWHSGEQGRQDGGGLGQVIEVDNGQDSARHWA